MKVNLFDHNREQLFPLTLTRPTASLRVGIVTIAEKWEHELRAEIGYRTADYLTSLFPELRDADVHINGSCLPTADLVGLIRNLENGQGIRTGNETVVAVRSATTDWSGIEWRTADATFISYPEDLFTLNEQELIADYERITAGRTSAPLSDSNRVTGEGRIFLESGARVEGAILNPNGGVIYVGTDAEIMEGSVVYGSLGLGEHAALKLSSKIYGATTLGPYCKVGGEVNNSILQGFSNKGHDGFLGNSVLGEWCNIGADSNNSNLKNNYAEVKLWDYTSGRFRNTGKQFCGLIMGDHSKCGINTMFNTGTVVGVSSNIFGSGFPRNFVPSFAWGGASGFTTYQLRQAFETMNRVMNRRGKELTEDDRKLYEHLFNELAPNRFWETNKSTSNV